MSMLALRDYLTGFSGKSIILGRRLHKPCLSSGAGPKPVKGRPIQETVRTKEVPHGNLQELWRIRRLQEMWREGENLRHF